MKLIDDVKITVKAGNGGNGVTVVKQMFASKKTAPDGGNGGNGGNIYFKADQNVTDLSFFQYKKKILGNPGEDGSRKDLDGKNGEDITVLLPFGTIIKNETTKEHVELTTDLPFCVAYGGTGGIGNHDYKLDIKKINPRVNEGTKGDEYQLHLILNLIADIGLVGLPNAGKSSLLKSITNATPKIGDYPFTTLSPNLGVYKSKVIADVPGLMEGAAGGKGLGISFLKHISKTKILLHCIDATIANPKKYYDIIRNEFGAFDSQLLSKEEIILLTKKDLVTYEQLDRCLADLKSTKRQIIPVSIHDAQSLNKVKDLILSFN